MNNNTKKRIFLNCTFSCILTFIILILVLAVARISPFGNNSIAIYDAEVQYLDFFGYLSNILHGKDSISFSNNLTLGDSGIGVFCYYLSSPINIIIALFSKENYIAFFTIIYIIKILMCSITFSYFLQKRFEGKIQNILVILLSLCYSLIQYNTAQALNIMWLDGVYMLPLMMLGVYYLINNKKIALLSVSTGLSILFNWYTGGINCIFSVLYFLTEFSLYIIEKDKNEKTKIKEIIKEFIKIFFLYIISMIIGVMLSAVLFLPNIFALRNGVGSKFDLKLLKNDFNGNIVSAIQKYRIGANSTIDSLALYCGSIPILGVIGLFASKNIKNKEKIVLGISLLISILTCYYKPFYFVFSLFKEVGSCYFRFGYTIAFSLIFTAAYYYSKTNNKNERSLIKETLIFSFVLLLLEYVKPQNEEKHVYFTCIGIIANTILIYFFINKKYNKKVITTGLIIITSCELFYNAHVCLPYETEKINKYSEYMKNQIQQIEEVKKNDNSIYRISQTKTRNFNDEDKSTANYNESVNLNYMSIMGYTSCPNNNVCTFLKKMGYRFEGERMNIVNTSIISADSLLGVKYVLSPYDIKGLEKVEQYGKYNDKYVYLNKYALPLAFKYYSNNHASYNNNPFEYQNEVYSELIGEKCELFKKANYQISKNENEITFEIENTNKNYVTYANFMKNYKDNVYIDINNGKYKCEYAKWLGQDVVYIMDSDKSINYLKIYTTDGTDLDNIGEEQIYYLDLEELQKATEKIKSNSVQSLELEKGGKIRLKVNSDNDSEKALLTIPYINGFTAYNNGKKINIEKFEDCFTSIPLSKGENNIIIKYRMPGLTKGICISIIGFVLLLLVQKVINKKETL